MDGTGPLTSILSFASEAVKQGSESALGSLLSTTAGVSQETQLAIFDIEFAPDGPVERLKPLTSPALLEQAFIRFPGAAGGPPPQPVPGPPKKADGGGGVPFEGE